MKSNNSIGIIGELRRLIISSFQKAQLAAIEAKIKENRRIREEKEKQEALERERCRRTQGKEIVELRQKFKVGAVRELE